ncbi:hypothetical protein KUW09_25060 [Mameliella alba]|nr:hypothetical protein [Antarctobacter heliothermus]MBY6147333.1 hypothetical protein [Mameliella alba]MCA0957389.1 hypothetical protein [Mameliella alba]
MNPDDLIKRAEDAADLCNAQGFSSTAQALRVLAEEMRDSVWLIDQMHDARMQQAQAHLFKTQPRS